MIVMHWTSSSIWTKCGKRLALPSVHSTGLVPNVTCAACLSHVRKLEVVR